MKPQLLCGVKLRVLAEDTLVGKGKAPVGRAIGLDGVHLAHAIAEGVAERVHIFHRRHGLGKGVMHSRKELEEHEIHICPSAARSKKKEGEGGGGGGGDGGGKM